MECPLIFSPNPKKSFSQILQTAAEKVFLWDMDTTFFGILHEHYSKKSVMGACKGSCNNWYEFTNPNHVNICADQPTPTPPEDQHSWPKTYVHSWTNRFFTFTTPPPPVLMRASSPRQKCIVCPYFFRGEKIFQNLSMATRLLDFYWKWSSRHEYSVLNLPMSALVLHWRIYTHFK